ncbi:MAG: GAF domain-containing sensor histidine kinase, partial [Gemmatimonadota bacterium]|nr:GAF domain-containing sensor histidine kinase [Gemmatimonadota bacterium]
ERLLLRERAARAEAEAAGGQARFLAEVSELLATSLDVEATLRSLAYLTVPRLGDSCIVYLVGDDGEIRRLDAMHVDPEKERALREQLQRHPPQLESLIPPVARALRSGTPEIVREVTPAALKAHPGDPTHRGIAEEVGLRSLIVVPLIARGRTLGALSYGVQHPRPRFGDADLPLATEVARKAALALDNSRLYAASQRAVATREKVLAVVCHDLRNPLGTILLSSTALSRSSPTEVWAEAGPELLASIAASAEQMEYLIKDLADLTRLETGRVALARSRHEPWQLLDEAVLVLSPLARAGGLRLVCDPVGDLPGVRVARDRIIQVFSNLVGNAIKATPPGGTITLGAHRWGTGVCFSVADDGPGMPPEKAARLFDRFWESTLTGRSEFGLGLHITRALIDAHGGRVWAESTPGEGTTVRFTVGAAERRESASGEAAALGAA